MRTPQASRRPTRFVEKRREPGRLDLSNPATSFGDSAIAVPDSVGEGLLLAQRSQELLTLDRLA